MAKMRRAIALARSSGGALRRIATLIGPLEEEERDLAGKADREEHVRRCGAAMASRRERGRRARADGADRQVAARDGVVRPGRARALRRLGATPPGDPVGEPPPSERAHGPPATVTSPKTRPRARRRCRTAR